MRFSITREGPDRLQRRIWTFSLHAQGHSETEPPKIKLDRYVSETRETTRHRWKAAEYRFSSSQTNDDWRYGKYIPQNEVDLPADVRDEAIRFITDRLTVEIPKGHFERQEEERGRQRR